MKLNVITGCDASKLDLKTRKNIKPQVSSLLQYAKYYIL